MNSLLKLLKDKDAKLKIINKNNDFINKYSNLNFLRIKICNILKKYFKNKKEKEDLLLKMNFLIWRNDIPNKFFNLSYEYNNQFSISNYKPKNPSAFNNSELKISTNNTDKDNEQICYLNIFSKINKVLLTESFSNTESDIKFISCLDKIKYFIIIIIQIFKSVELRNIMFFIKNLIVHNESIKKQDEFIYKINEIENPRLNVNLEIANNQEELEILVKENTYNYSQKTNNGMVDYFNMNYNNNLFHNICKKYEIDQSNNFQIERIESNHSAEISKTNITEINNQYNYLKIKSSIEKILLIFDSSIKNQVFYLKSTFLMNFLKTANNYVFHDKIAILTLKIKYEKLSYLIRKKEKNLKRKYFKKYAFKTRYLKENEEKEELEFFQNTNYSLILFGILERISIKKFSEKEMFHRFFSNLRLKYLQVNFYELSNRLTDLDNSNFLNEYVNRKNTVLNRLLFSKFLQASKEFTIKSCFYKWKSVYLKSTTIEQSSILNSLPNLEEEFTERINEIEIKYRNMMDNNKSEYDNKVSEKDKEISKLKIDVQKLSDKLADLQKFFDNEKNNIISNYEK